MQQFWRDEAGQSVHEYGLVIALVAMLLVAVLKIFAGRVTSWFADRAGQLTSF